MHFFLKAKFLLNQYVIKINVVPIRFRLWLFKVFCHEHKSISSKKSAMILFIRLHVFTSPSTCFIIASLW